MKKLYKAHIRYMDECGRFEVHYKEHDSHRESKAYYYINVWDYKDGTREKKVDKHAPNAFAFDTKEKALFNLLKRRQRMQVLLRWQMKSNEKVVAELFKMNGIDKNQNL